MAGPGPGDPDEQYDFLFKLVLVGDASVGKTCVVQRFKTGAFSERQSSTIGVDFTMKTLEIQGKRVKVGGPAWDPRAGVGLALFGHCTARAPTCTREHQEVLLQRGRGLFCSLRIVLRCLANPFCFYFLLFSAQAWALESELGTVRQAPALVSVCVRARVGGSAEEEAPPSRAHTLYFASK